MEANKAEPSSRRAPGTSYIKAEVSEVEARQQTNISEMPAGSTPSPRSRRAKHQDHRVRRAARDPIHFPATNPLNNGRPQSPTKNPSKAPSQSKTGTSAPNAVAAGLRTREEQQGLGYLSTITQHSSLKRSEVPFYFSP